MKEFAVECPRCHTQLPDVAHFCHRCGMDERSPDKDRRRAFAVKPDEPVASFAVVSSIMPRGAGEKPQTYRIAIMIALVVALLAACFGALPIAVLVAAFAIPIVYIVYLYDVNLWDDHPIQVTAMAFVLTMVLGIGFTLLWFNLLGGGESLHGMDILGQGGPTIGGFLLAAIAVPVIGEVLRQLGPVYLASRPRYDDLLDGVSFGVISGVAYSTADTLVRQWPLIVGGLTREIDPGLWMSLIFLEGFVKPLIIGTASGIACAEFSGLGKGYDGFTPRYFRGVAEAIAANILYQGGVYLFGFVDNPTMGVVLTILWGLLILAVLLLRIRAILHVALIEAALEDAQRDTGIVDGEDQTFCAQCEMPLLNRAAFCSACGAAVRTRHKEHHPKLPPPGPASSASFPGTAGSDFESAPTRTAERPASEDQGDRA
ncbi:zinc-ribbon domain-containing protein [Naumannella halotolerans]|uniref:zinc-ribbon domain-containing protein n=1 Tax=Naumannella halotolerans TaxID=993414 RepID=UPI00370D918A